MIIDFKKVFSLYTTSKVSITAREEKATEKFIKKAEAIIPKLLIKAAKAGELIIKLDLPEYVNIDKAQQALLGKLPANTHISIIQDRFYINFQKVDRSNV